MTVGKHHPYHDVYANRMLDNRTYRGQASPGAYPASPPLPLSYPFARRADLAFAETAARHIAMVSGAVNLLREKTERLTTAAPGSVFRDRSVTVSDKDAVSGSAMRNAELGAFTLHTVKLAATQENTGFQLPSSRESAFASGWNSLAITASGRARTISFYVGATDTNETALRKMRDAVNRSDAGVIARLVKDADTGKLAIRLTAAAAGETNRFELADVTGNAVSASGAGLVTTYASDAQYRIDDGPLMSSSSNTIKLDGGLLTLSLGRAGSEARIEVGADTGKIKAAVKEAIDSFHALLELANPAGTTARSAVNQLALRSLLRASQDASLGELGIRLSGNGRLHIEEDKLGVELAERYFAAAELLGGPDGWADRLTRAAERVQSSPVQALFSGAGTPFQRYIGYDPNQQYRYLMPLNGLFLNEPY